MICCPSILLETPFSGSSACRKHHARQSTSTDAIAVFMFSLGYLFDDLVIEPEFVAGFPGSGAIEDATDGIGIRDGEAEAVSARVRGVHVGMDSRKIGRGERHLEWDGSDDRTFSQGVHLHAGEPDSELPAHDRRIQGSFHVQRKTVFSRGIQKYVRVLPIPGRHVPQPFDVQRGFRLRSGGSVNVANYRIRIAEIRDPHFVRQNGGSVFRGAADDRRRRTYDVRYVDRNVFERFVENGFFVGISLNLLRDQPVPGEEIVVVPSSAEHGRSRKVKGCLLETVRIFDVPSGQQSVHARIGGELEIQ